MRIVMKKRKCVVCNYLHSGDEPPASCPVCGADKSFFVAAESGAVQDTGGGAEQSIDETLTVETAKPVERKWKCTICGYIHTGDEPPEICPICAADKSYFIEITEAEQVVAGEGSAAEAAATAQAPGGSGATAAAPEKTEQFGFIGKLIMKLHLHHISVHTPNGIIPIALIFLVLGIVFGYTPLEKASFFNLIVVFLSMPVVLFTGFIVWQMKFRGALTPIFKIKIAAAATVTVLTSILVFWRIIDANIAFAGDTGTWIYVSVGAINLVAAGIAGHIGGKLALGS